MDLINEITKHFDESYKQGKTPWIWSSISDNIIKFADMASSEFPNGKLLDIGCGSGWLSIFFAEKGFEVDGIDSSSLAIAEANDKKKSKDLNKLNFIKHNALTYPYEKEKYDIVFDRGFFHHIPEENWQEYLNVILGTLKEGGLFLLTAFSSRSAKEFLEPEEMKHLWRKRLSKSGHWSYDHFFNSEIIKKTFSDSFEIIEIDDHNTDKSEAGLRVLYAVMRKK